MRAFLSNGGGGGSYFATFFAGGIRRLAETLHRFFLLFCPFLTLYFLLNSRTVNETEIICIHNYFTQLYVVSEDDVWHLKPCFLRFSTWLTFSRPSRRVFETISKLKIGWTWFYANFPPNFMYVSRNDNCVESSLQLNVFISWMSRVIWAWA